MLVQRFSGGHARLHRGMAALDLRDIQRAGGIADQQAAREAQPWKRLKPALGDGARAIADAPCVVECLPNLRVRFEALKFLERRQVGIAVVQPEHEADCDLVILEMVEERAAVGLQVERPADGVYHLAGSMLPWIDLPQLLDADTERLRIHAVA
jgi:hypothetical protein